ncbi:MAG: PAS domain S-box protein [Dehalococcoidia bacterium]|nr:PAS domain S-box protein [Dehalococcoidia bacterium]
MAELEILETKHKKAEEALRESEEIYRVLVDQMTEGYMIVRGDRILFANRRWVEILGIPVKKLIGENYWKLVPPENQEQTRQALKKVTEGGEIPALWEFVHPGKDEHGIPIEVSIREVIYKGKPSYAVVLRDITERKWVEEVLQESERVLSQIVESNPISTFVIDREHIITYWNKACEKLTGISASEVIGTKRQWLPLYFTERPVLADFIVDRMPDIEIAKYYWVKYGKSSMIEGAYEAEDFFPHFGASGKWLHSTAAPLRDNDGNIIGAIETLQDITERKQAEHALKKSERRYRDLFESASEAIIIRDLCGNIIEVNQAASHLIGYTVDELTSMNIRQLLTPESFGLAMEMQQRQLKGETANQRFELELIRKDKAKTTIEVAIRLITSGGNGKPQGIQTIARDVTDEKKWRDGMRFYIQKVLVAQEEERKRIARDLHDDTTQLVLLLTHKLDTVSSDPNLTISEPVRETLAELYDSTVEILNSLRSYSQDLRPAILDHMGLVAALEWMTDRFITEYKIKADVQLDMKKKELPQEVQLVLFRIAQEALLNIKRHAEASRVVIRLELKKGNVKMVIADNGKGLSQVGINDLSSEGKAGLIGMRERAQLLHGTLNIESDIGKGTALIVEIPLLE